MVYHLVAYNSNHSLHNNSMFIRTIIFHNTVTTMLGLASFSLSERDGDSNRFQPAENLFITQTQTDQINGHLRSQLVQLRSTFHGFAQRHTIRDNQLPGRSGPAYPWAQSDSPQGAHNRMGPDLS